MSKRLALFACALAATPAFAHDFWLQPRDFSIAAPGAVVLAIYVGHGPDRQRWGVGIDRVIQFVSFGPDGKADRKPELTLRAPGADGVLRLTKPGTHLLAFQSAPTPSDLPAVRFNSYLRDEGLTIPLADRAQAGRDTANGREIYSRRAKAIVQIGPIDKRQGSVALKRLGLTLEVVPEHHPLTLKPGEALPVRIFFRGAPLAGATVKLTNLDADAKPVATQRTDGAGRAAFLVPRRGKWLVNTIWSTKIANRQNADYETIFSSLTFGFADS